MNKEHHKTFFAYVIPSVFAFALSGVYTIVDGFFIGQKLGDPGLASITLGYPFSALIQAVGTGIGLSGAIRFTILAAQGENKKQEACFSCTAILMAAISILLSIFLFCFAEPMLQLFGAKGNVCSLAAEYTRVIALGAIFQLLATGFVPFIRNMNGAAFAMAAMILGFLTNIVLDYAFVWRFDFGMAGAAYATVIGQTVTMVSAIGFFIFKKTGFYLPAFHEFLHYGKDTLKRAFSPFGLTFSPIATMLFMNRFLLLYGNEQEVAVYGCIGYITSIIYLLLQGVGDGSQPLISRSYGEGNMQGVKITRRAAYLCAFVITIICMVSVFLARAEIGILFGASEGANTDVIRYLPLFLATLLFVCYARITTSYFYATEQTLCSYILVYAEPAITFLLLLLLPLFFQLNGVWLAVPLAQVFTFTIAIILKHHIIAYEKCSSM